MKEDFRKEILQGISKSLNTFSINRLKDIIHKSEKEKIEYGTMFCSDTDTPPFNNITYSELCKGTECKIVIDTCKGKNRIGVFHTHPRTKYGKNFEYPSGKDIYETIYHKHIFSCIGAIVENNDQSKPSKSLKPKINCFVPSFHIDPISVIKFYNVKDDYDKKLSNILKTESSNITKKMINDLSNSYDKMSLADDKLYQASNFLSEKLMTKDIDNILKNHSTLAKSINKLRLSTRLCISSVSSDMHKADIELHWLYDSKNISSDEFIELNSALEEIGREFHNCRCLSRSEKS